MKKMLFSVFLFLSLNSLAEPVEDNSFLAEEAYNQEPGVVQFINVYQKSSRTKDWSYVFINEIPIVSQTHQFSYEIPYSYIELIDKTEVGDIKFNYRNEFYRSDVLVATGRLSWISSTGNSKNGMGSGSNGYEASLITSVKVNNQWVQHWNVGAAFTPKAKNTIGDQADNTKFFWNLSNVYIFTDNLNFMLEMSNNIEQETIANDVSSWSTTTLVSPSLRYAFDVADWQFVPGLARPFLVGENANSDDQILAYFSIEGKMW